MKIKELQIDDLILCDFSAFTEPPYKEKCVVRKISRDAVECMPLDENGNDRYDYISEVYESEIEPIPLTAEILEKNGFTRFGTDYILKERHFGLDNPSTPSNYLDNYWLRVSIKAVHIEFVHELQHALRLCGIEKEIEL